MRPSSFAGLLIAGALTVATSAHAEPTTTTALPHPAAAPCPAGSHREGDPASAFSQCVADEIVCPTNCHRVGSECVATKVECPSGSVFRGTSCYPRSRAVAIRTTGQVFTLMGVLWAFVGAVTARTAALRSDGFATVAAINAAAPLFGHALGAMTLGISLWAVGAKVSGEIDNSPQPALSDGQLHLRVSF